MKAVRFDAYGGIDVLRVADVPQPVPTSGQVLVRVHAAGINPGEAKIRDGALHSMWPSTFPSGQGSDLAGTVEQVGDGVTRVAVGDEVIGWVDTRSSQAEYAVVEATNVVPKPKSVPWEVAGALPVAGFTAWAAVRAVAPQANEVLVVAGAAGGVGSIAVQLAKRDGAIVVGIAGQANNEWLRQHDVIPVGYGDGVADQIRAAVPRVDAFVDTYGGDYVALAVDQFGVDPARVDTIAAFDAVKKYGVKSDANAAGASPTVLSALAGLIASGELSVPIAATYPLVEVREAYTELAKGHVRGKIVLLP
jgi:NADPH:quinone reductase-like Zn-dependent oxidoreductase